MRHPVGVGTLLAVLSRRPGLFLEAVRSYFAFRRRGAAGQSAHYLSWRAQTAYGSSSTMPPGDMAEFLAWRRALRRGRRRR